MWQRNGSGAGTFYSTASGVQNIGDRFTWTPAAGTSVAINFTTTFPKNELNPGDYISIIQGSTAGNTYSNFTIEDPTTIRITSSYNANTSMSIILEPPFATRFAGTDCDVLQGNAIISRPNPLFQDIDFSTSQTIPINYDALKNYTAKKATYPLSSFTQTSILSPIYKSTNITNLNSTSSKDEILNFNTGSGYNSISSVGINVLYYEDSSLVSADPVLAPFTPRINQFQLKYIITPEEELIEITPENTIQGMVEQTIASFANIPKEYTNSQYLSRTIPQPSPNVKGTSFASTGSYDLAYNGNARYFVTSATGSGSEGQSILELTSNVYDGSFSGYMPNIPGINGGLLYPAGIENTSAADLPGKAKKLLAEKNLIQT